MRIALLATVLSLLIAGPLEAQVRATTAEAFAGWSGFLDETIDDFTLAGGRVRFPLTDRIGTGGEITWLDGRGVERYVGIDGVVTIDLMKDRSTTPYIVATTGLLSHREQVGSGPGSDVLQVLWLREWHASGGLGVRARVTDGVDVAGEGRVGTEGDFRIFGVIGYRFGG